ncbi:MAG: tRNA pseudouridine(55) synthase TruB [Bdellovibrionaceae bacterium]|nr:tRNA pseudouridine(55) synthase TruB [Pseudobdellovibrionaceae bacterium]
MIKNFIANEKLNGVFLIRKEKGVTSHDVVFGLRRILKDKQVGHVGTLDPLAEGLLVCLVGESVKLSDYLMGADKTYRLQMKLGVETDTWDITGKTLKTSDMFVAENEWLEAIESLSGVQKLPIPLYSAKKVDGKKLYEIARKDNTLDNFEGPEKDMKFWDIRVVDMKFPNATVEFSCSKGSFVRSWIYILGKRLGVGATMTGLERIAIGGYRVSDAVTLSELKEKKDFSTNQNSSFFLSPWQALKDRSVLELEFSEAEKLKNGLVSYSLSKRIRDLGFFGEIFCFFNRQLRGILSVSDTIEVKRIFVNPSH